MNREVAYRNSSISGASPIGLLLALFDRMSADLGRAAVAIRNNDIESRCNEINHALIILGQLESWVDLEKGGDAARQLAGYYTYVRAKILEASANQSTEILAALIESILNVRSSWQRLDATAAEEPATLNRTFVSSSAAAAYGTQAEAVRFSQSA